MSDEMNDEIDTLPMTIDDVIAEAHATAIEKGWHEECREMSDYIANIHREVSEAWEAYRDPSIPEDQPIIIIRGKPEGVAVELADAVIRIADMCGQLGYDLQRAIKIKMAYNKTRPYRHGGKRA